VRRCLLTGLLLALALAALPARADAARGSCVAGHAGPTCSVWKGTVTNVGDGDTIDVDVARDGTRRSRRVRIAGVQAMELSAYSTRRRLGDCHAVEATLRLERLVRGSRGRVRLAALRAESASRGRLLRTVAVKLRGRWRDVGTTLLGEGLALWLPGRTEWAPNSAYGELSQSAIAAQRGMFDPSACGVGPSAGAPLKLWVNWDADGNDITNPSGEWVRVKNLDPVNAVPLGGWHLRDSGLRRFTFPAHASIPPGGTVTVDVGPDGDDQAVFGWGLRQPVFENASGDERAIGDGAYLFDPLGNVRALMLYPCHGTCTDVAQGAVAVSAEPRRRRESITLANLTAAPLDLEGYVLKSPPYSYPLESGAVLPAGGSLRIEVAGAPEEDTALERHWGLASPILRNGGDVVRLSTYTDITIACTAWGDKSC
jgi:endonuclease YncB( thermonuclease family)